MGFSRAGGAEVGPYGVWLNRTDAAGLSLSVAVATYDVSRSRISPAESAYSPCC